MMKFVHVFNYSDLMEFTIFKCGSGYEEKDPRQLQINCLGFLFCHPCLHFVRVLKEVRILTVS